MLLPSVELAGRKRGRPRGLWKGRVTPLRYFADTARDSLEPEVIYHDSDTDGDTDERDADLDTQSSSSSKRRRYSPSLTTSDELDLEYWDYARRCSPPSERVSNWVRRTKIMDTTTTARRGTQIEARTTCDYEDWEDLKDLFARAAEQYESDDAAEALPLLRGVVHECHRFLIFYQDPSVLFTNPARHQTSSPATLTPSDERIARDWGSEHPSKPQKLHTQTPPRDPRKCKSAELPTAFHAILGTALFLFGNLIAQDSSLALPGEPNSPCPYWFAALDVFETGENLPSRTNGRGYDSPEDWRMAVVWGRTLVCLADEIITRSLKAKDDPASRISAAAQFSADEPNWPQESPFSAIAARRPPVTRRMSLTSASPNDLMVLAMDQFSRGIFHMPHPQHHLHPHPSPISPISPGTGTGTNTIPTGPPPPLTESFSRAKELFTIASEVLGAAERFEIASERQYWASWADSVFNQMKMEADMDAWRGPITRARGRCWLIVGSAKVEELEAALERDEMDVLLSEDAQEAREGLATAISFFERAKGSASSTLDPESHELRPLLAEALVTLANLTIDENKREELYARAQVEGGSSFHLGEQDEAMETDET